MSVVTYQLVDNVAVITLNNPPVNALSQTLRTGILDAVKRAQTDVSKAIVIICQGKTFIAGADIKEFGKPAQSPVLADVIKTIEASTKPVIAAIHGTALGGGLELALACHYRCALTSAKVGLPEVTLGLLPGGGGTQRLPRLIGVEAAMETILSGKALAAENAGKLGLLDRVVDKHLLDEALLYAKHLIEMGVGNDGQAPRRTGELTIDSRQLPETFFADARQMVAKRHRGYLAQQCVVDALEAAATQPFTEGLKRERELFQQCVESPLGCSS